MRRIAAFVALLSAALAVAAPQGLAADGPKKKDNDTHVQLLAINDFHGHLAPNTPGTIRPTGSSAAVPAGGVEYLATHIKSLRTASTNTITVGAGDLIGASPLVSGLFHDEPAIEALNAIGLDVSGVGNHEFDEGIGELLRMQNGGCHPVDGCQDGGPFGGAFFQYLAANVFFMGTDDTVLPEYEIHKIDNAKVAFIGLTLEGTPSIVTPSGVAGLEFEDEIETVNALAQRLRNEEGVRAFVILIHEGGQQNAPFAQGNADINGCENFSGAIVDIVNGLDPLVDVVVSAHTHQPYICRINDKLVTSASSFGRLITDIDLVIDHQTKDVTSATARNVVVTQDNPATPVVEVEKDPALTTILNKYTELSNPLARQEIGSITADITRTANAAGESALGDVIADAQLEATAPTDFGGSVIAFMNPGGIRNDLLFAKTYGVEAPGVVVYGELFDVQPFGNSLVVKTCTGAQIDALLEQQFNNPVAGQMRVLQVSAGFTYTWNNAAAVGSRVDPSTIKLNGVTLDPLASYRVTMNSFLATGGDNFGVFNQCTDPLGGEIDLDAFARYVDAHSPVAPGPQNRITKLG
jgi:5'-nucleotidase